MNNRIFFVEDSEGVPLETQKKTWYYKTLKGAKSAARQSISRKNRRLDKLNKIPFSHLKVVECELVEKDIHPL